MSLGTQQFGTGPSKEENAKTSRTFHLLVGIPSDYDSRDLNEGAE
jgi:hypothetical protein